MVRWPSRVRILVARPCHDLFARLAGILAMSDEQDTRRSEADAELEREIRKERPFSLWEAMGRMAGPGGMKGASPVTRERQVELEIGDYLRANLSNAESALQCVLLRRVMEASSC